MHVIWYPTTGGKVTVARGVRSLDPKRNIGCHPLRLPSIFSEFMSSSASASPGIGTSCVSEHGDPVCRPVDRFQKVTLDTLKTHPVC